MCADVRTPLGPELSLITQQQSPSRRNAVVMAVMEEDFGRWAEVWALPPEPILPTRQSTPSASPRSFWRRLLGRSEWRRSPRATSARSGATERLAAECPDAGHLL